MAESVYGAAVCRDRVRVRRVVPLPTLNWAASCRRGSVLLRSSPPSAAHGVVNAAHGVGRANENTYLTLPHARQRSSALRRTVRVLPIRSKHPRTSVMVALIAMLGRRQERENRMAAEPYRIEGGLKLTKTIPIVTIDLDSDPVARVRQDPGPAGGNVTGIWMDVPEIAGKQLEILTDAAPGLRRVAVVWDARIARLLFTATEAGARRAGVTVHSAPLQDEHEPEGVVRRRFNIASRRRAGSRRSRTPAGSWPTARTSPRSGGRRPATWTVSRRAPTAEACLSSGRRSSSCGHRSTGVTPRAGGRGAPVTARIEHIGGCALADAPRGSTAAARSPRHVECRTAPVAADVRGRADGHIRRVHK